MTKKILVRADDLGYSEGINLGIAKTVNEGIIRNIGVMVNMPTAKQGLDLIKNADVCLGQHTVICQGKPLVDPKLIPSITTPDGFFKPSSLYRNSSTDIVNLDEVILEIEAQYQRFVELVGHKPDYFEGHAIFSKNFIKGLQIVADRHQCDMIQIPDNIFDSNAVAKFKGKKLYTHMGSMAANYSPFKTLKETVYDSHDDGIPMMVCHPGYLDDYILTHSSLTIPRAQEVAMLTDPATQQWLDENNAELITYLDL